MNSKILERAGLTFLAVVLFCFGFYLGIKYEPVDSNSTKNQGKSISSNLDNQPSSSAPSANNKIVGKEVSEVSWVKTGAEPVCPESHPIKGRLTDGQKLYYLPENKTASRVKPDICFLNEEYAKNTAGFIRKY